MGYRVLADLTMAVHFLFLAYLALGGFLAWLRPRLVLPHLAVAAWGLISVTTGVDCPLTHLEDHARRLAGQAGLPPAGFIDHYLEGVIYPEEYTTHARLLVAAAVLISWTGLLLRHRARRRLTPEPAARTPAARTPGTSAETP